MDDIVFQGGLRSIFGYLTAISKMPCQQGRYKFVWTDNFMEIIGPNDRWKNSAMMLILVHWDRNTKVKVK